MYFKITNAEENHHGFQYVDGLNILKDEFNNDPNQSCCKSKPWFAEYPKGSAGRFADPGNQS